jgi:hypothetical protein
MPERPPQALARLDRSAGRPDGCVA